MPDDLSTVREFRFNRVKIYLLIATLALFLLGLVSTLTTIAFKIIPDYKLMMVTREKGILMEDLKLAQEKIEVLRQAIGELAKSDEQVRLAVDLPVIDQATWLAGIGGALPARGVDPAQDLMVTLAQLEHQVEVQKQSYPEILEKIDENIGLAHHTPAICPVEYGRITSGYGWRKDPFTGVRKPHRGVDLSAPRGTPVYAPADGEVSMAKWEIAYGKTIMINHSYGYETVYCHLQSLEVYPHQRVKRGDLIATVGNTGRSTAPHLHYEVWVNMEPINPLNYFMDESLDKLK
jgi:murein DD-endopeptidase MepM/ murein hydrolase activator NlpD